MSGPNKKTGVVMPAYNAAETLERVYRDIFAESAAE